VGFLETNQRRSILLANVETLCDRGASVISRPVIWESSAVGT